MSPRPRRASGLLHGALLGHSRRTAIFALTVDVATGYCQWLVHEASFVVCRRDLLAKGDTEGQILEIQRHGNLD